ncbi:hypothetical protein [Amycolatopsis magusensis]|uniref:hypothetical protein n=1 Tax=Amycolatopsis magusensis TaxID=882444 RepID=UPI0024A95572|nr:hypothetical protein [Amycolatopsis magusensis]MDI5975916.1 hypothetical protein [Amycolatopsis magusensis]
MALGATALLHLLLLTTPRARLFFGWIMVLLTAIAVVIPPGLVAELSPRLTTAIINLAITLTLSGVASTAVRRAEREDRREEPGEFPSVGP